MEEIWKDIKNYEGLYRVSNLGRIKSLNYNGTGEERIMDGNYDRDGHKKVVLTNRIKKYPFIHRLVAQAFIPNPENKPEVHHIDYNPSNNIVDNLMWVTKEEHAKFHPERYKNASRASAMVLSKSVLQYTNDGQFIKEYPSAHEAARQNGLFTTNICNCCNGKSHYKTAGGFIWKYKNEGN